ncbi:MBL fold metallo-hydrolase [Actinacidiphila glaucinigra]|uniref:MBL fold metallo-hydrolase n=1 Tax=Actinacidiphila glaucinigra TaxID=235986 RepID=UPI0037C68D34
MDSLLEFGPRSGPPDMRLYISGDTLMVDALEEVGRRYPDVDLALLHLGGTTLPGGFLATMDGAQGAELAACIRPRLVMPIHYDDYTVMKSPLAEFLSEASRHGLSERIVHCHTAARRRSSRRLASRSRSCTDVKAPASLQQRARHRGCCATRWAIGSERVVYPLRPP